MLATKTTSPVGATEGGDWEPNRDVDPNRNFRFDVARKSVVRYAPPRPMIDPSNPAPLRWRLPVLQLAVCLIFLFPVRGRLWVEIFVATHSHMSAPSAGEQRIIVLPPVPPQEEPGLDSRAKLNELCLRVPTVLDLPVLIAQLPYAIVTKREWIPGGIMLETWRALTWPFAGMVFWWWLGRGLEALRATRIATVNPRLGWVDTGLGAIFIVIGGICLVGIVTSTPDDRKDGAFISLLSGGLLWGFLAALLIWTRIRQWRITKKKRMKASVVLPSPA